MVMGGEKTHPIVIDDGMVKEWVGIGWIELRYANKSDLNTLPTVIEGKTL